NRSWTGLGSGGWDSCGSAMFGSVRAHAGAEALIVTQRRRTHRMVEGSRLRLWHRNQSMTLHDAAHLRRIRGRIGGQLSADFAKIFRTKHARRQDTQAFRGSRAAVVEAVNDTATDEHRIAGPDFDYLAVDRPC